MGVSGAVWEGLVAAAPVWKGALWTEGTPLSRLIEAAILGAVVGLVLRIWLRRLATPKELLAESGLARADRKWGSAAGPNGLLEGLTAAAFSIYLASATLFAAQRMPEEAHLDWFGYRLLLHLALIAFLITATFIDLWEYIIPDEVVFAGLVVALGLHATVNHVHLVPVWIDWNLEHPITGPYIPEWLKTSPLGHGVAVTVVGAIVAASGTWLLRGLSGWMLGTEALGFGDVTLMAMIGAAIGWQPSLWVLLLAPLVGLVWAMLAWLGSGRIALPYGPCLAVATFLVLCGWRWLWLPSRLIFGHLPSLLGLIAAAVGLLIALLWLVKGVRSLPTR